MIGGLIQEHPLKLKQGNQQQYLQLPPVEPMQRVPPPQNARRAVPKSWCWQAMSRVMKIAAPWQRRLNRPSVA